jgi:hypothetical protein
MMYGGKEEDVTDVRIGSVDSSWEINVDGTL